MNNMVFNTTLGLFIWILFGTVAMTIAPIHISIRMYWKTHIALLVFGPLSFAYVFYVVYKRKVERMANREQ